MKFLESLEFIRNKGNCRFTVDRAKRELHKIRYSLDEKEYLYLSVELNHISIGERKGVFNDLINKTIQKYTVTPDCSGIKFTFLGKFYHVHINRSLSREEMSLRNLFYSNTFKNKK